MATYERNLVVNLQRLCARVHTGRYRPLPVCRVYIPKSDGDQRPLGVPALEDKIVQGAVAEVLNAVYEKLYLARATSLRVRPSLAIPLESGLQSTYEWFAAAQS